MDDPTLQEFYSLSRSTTQDQALNLINPTSQDPSSRSSSRLQHRPSNDPLYPSSISSNANDYLYLGNQIQHSNPHQRRHTTDIDTGNHYPMLDNDTASLKDDYQSYQNHEGTPFIRPSQQHKDDQERLHDIDDLEESYRSQSSGMDNDSHSINSKGHNKQPQHQQEPTPLPKIPLFVLSVVIFSEPLTSTILFPFVYFMVRDFGIAETEDQIGFYCGLIASSFFFAQFLTAMFWGNMSDRFGRRPILLLGLCGASITGCFFGLSKNLAWAITSRFMCGFLNGNVGVAKSMLGEIADKTNQAQAFSVFGFAWGIGTIFGPVLGGYLANPAKNFPEIFGNWAFFIEYPYFLPCFVASLNNIVGFTVGYFFLEETRGRKKRNAVNSKMDDSKYGTEEIDECRSLKTPSILSRSLSTFDHDSESQPLFLSNPQHINLGKDMTRVRDYGSAATLTHDMNDSPNSFHSASARSTMSHRPPAARPTITFHQRATSASDTFPSLGNGGHHLPQTHQALPTDSTLTLFYQDQPLVTHGPCSHESDKLDRTSFVPSRVNVLPADTNNKELGEPSQIVVVEQERISSLAISAITAYAVLALHSIVFEEVYTLYAVTPLNSHGLGWTAIQLSKSLASMGLVQLFMQFVVYPRLERRFSAVVLFRAGQLIYMAIYLSFPLIRAFIVNVENGERAGQTQLIYYIVLIGLTTKHLGSVISYTSIMVMINNTSPENLLGTVNGIGQMCACLMRAIGPALGGTMWAWSLSNNYSFPFNYFFVFLLMAVIAVSEFFHSLSIPHDAGVKRD